MALIATPRFLEVLSGTTNFSTSLTGNSRNRAGLTGSAHFGQTPIGDEAEFGNILTEASEFLTTEAVSTEYIVQDG